MSGSAVIAPFPAPVDGPVVVVGAGTAGSVVARRLADAGYRVRLIEAGTGELPGTDPRLSQTDHLATHAVGDRWWSGLRVHRTAAGATVDYRLGRGVGGSSAVNGLMAECDLDDPALGPAPDVARARAAVLMHTERVAPAELGPLSAALLGADGARTVTLARRDGRRSDAATAYLAPALAARGDIELDADTVVDRIDVGPAPAVITATGRRIDAAAVVLCAGALHTPAILLRSGVTSGVGHHLQDHPSTVLHLSLRPGVGAGPGGLPTGALLERDGVQFLPLEHLGDGGGDGALLVALMEPAGAAGRVTLASPDPTAAPVVEFRLDDTSADLRRLAGGVRRALALLAGPSFAATVDSVAIDDTGTPPSALDDDDALERWLRRASGTYFHAAASCGIGRALDGSGRLVGAPPVYVADASAFGRIPRTGTHLPTVVLAERLVAGWIASADPSGRSPDREMMG